MESRKLFKILKRIGVLEIVCVFFSRVSGRDGLGFDIECIGI